MESGSDAEINAKVEEIINILHLPYDNCFPDYNEVIDKYSQNIEITLRLQSEFNLKVQEITKNIEFYREILEKSSYFEEIMRQMNSPEMVDRIERVMRTDPDHSQLELVVYGIGRLTPTRETPDVGLNPHWKTQDVEPCQMQLAFTLLLRDKFPWVDNDIVLYDPILSPLERRVISEFNCTIPLVNEGGRRTVSRPTLFFMPHCGTDLYDSVLDANWTPDNFSKIIILGNDFDTYFQKDLELWGSTKVKALRIRDHVRHEIPLPVVTMRNAYPAAPHAFSDEPATKSGLHVAQVFWCAFSMLSWKFFAWDGSLDNLNLDHDYEH